MTANTAPIFPLSPKVGYATLTAVDATASKNHDGTGVLNTSIFAVYTAGVNGGRVDDLIVVPLGSTAATVVRVFLNNGSANTTVANNTLIAERTIPQATLSETSELQQTPIPINRAIPPGYKVLVCLGTAVSAPGLQVSAFCGDY
jgi:hypothetical protein